MSRELALKGEIWPSNAEILLTPEEFSKVYDNFAPQLYRHALSRIGSKETAEDITGQVFLKAWDFSVKVNEPIVNIRAFLFRIAHNLITDHYRKRKFETIQLDTLPEQHRAFQSPKNLHEHAEEREVIHLVEETLTLLEDDYRDILVWRYVDELSIEEIMAVSGKSSNAIYVTLHRALKKIRVILAQKGI
ncbi:MAG: sigma-70 family RNA polymerase sigma factor [bacterium]|nr:sigma-70 family RNA polymerase sigma factor [bacterium]